MIIFENKQGKAKVAFRTERRTAMEGNTLSGGKIRIYAARNTTRRKGYGKNKRRNVGRRQNEYNGRFKAYVRLQAEKHEGVRAWQRLIYLR